MRTILCAYYYYQGTILSGDALLGYLSSSVVSPAVSMIAKAQDSRAIVQVWPSPAANDSVRGSVTIAILPLTRHQAVLLNASRADQQVVIRA